MLVPSDKISWLAFQTFWSVIETYWTIYLLCFKAFMHDLIKLDLYTISLCNGIDFIWGPLIMTQRSPSQVLSWFNTELFFLRKWELLNPSNKEGSLLLVFTIAGTLWYGSCFTLFSLRYRVIAYTGKLAISSIMVFVQ